MPVQEEGGARGVSRKSCKKSTTIINTKAKQKRSSLALWETRSKDLTSPVTTRDSDSHFFLPTTSFLVCCGVDNDDTKKSPEGIAHLKSLQL
jgi:hypothetical protein